MIDTADAAGNDVRFKPQDAMASTLDAGDTLQALVEQQNWTGCFELLETFARDNQDKLLLAEDGQLVPAWRWSWSQYLALPPEARRMFNTFNDKPAQARLDAAGEQKTDEQLATLESLHQNYFLTPAGKTATRMLGDLMFEQGRFPQAIYDWQLCLAHDPPGPEQRATLLVKMAKAYANLGDVAALAKVTKHLSQNYPQTTIRLAGETVDAATYASQLQVESPEQAAHEPDLTSPLAKKYTVAWRHQFVSEDAINEVISQIQRRYPTSVAGMNQLDATIQDQRAFISWLGSWLVMDLTTGKVLEENPKLDQSIKMFLAQINNPGYRRPSLQRVDDRLVMVSPVMNADGGLVTRSLKDGALIWKALNNTSLANYGFPPDPLTVGDTIYTTALNQANTTTWELLAVDLQTGDLKWQLPLGKLEGQRYQMRNMTLQPRLIHRNGQLLVITDAGLAMWVDLASRRIVAGAAYDIGNVADDNNLLRTRVMGISRRLPRAAAMRESSQAFAGRGGRIVFMESESDVIYCLDAQSNRMAWQRETGSDGALIGLKDNLALAFADGALQAIDMNTGETRWQSRHLSPESQILLAEHHIIGCNQTSLIALDIVSGKAVGITQLPVEVDEDATIIAGEDCFLIFDDMTITCLRPKP